MTFSFSDWKRKLPQKELKSLVDQVVDAVDQQLQFGSEANKFLNGGKLPAKNAAEIEAVITSAEKALLTTIGKLGPKDPATSQLQEAAKAIQALKIDHRELVGTLLSDFQGLDKGRAERASTAFKKALQQGDACKREATKGAVELTLVIDKFHKDVNALITMNGGVVHSSKKLAEETSKMLGRKVATEVSEAEYEKACRTQADLEDMSQAMKKLLVLLKS